MKIRDTDGTSEASIVSVVDIEKSSKDWEQMTEKMSQQMKRLDVGTIRKRIEAAGLPDQKDKDKTKLVGFLVAHEMKKLQATHDAHTGEWLKKLNQFVATLADDGSSTKDANAEATQVIEDAMMPGEGDRGQRPIEKKTTKMVPLLEAEPLINPQLLSSDDSDLQAIVDAKSLCLEINHSHLRADE